MAKQTFTSGQTLTAQQMNDLQTNDFNWSVSTQTASYTLQAADKGTREVMNMGSAGTVTVPNNTFNAGDIVWVHSIGSGTISLAAGTGMTLNSSAGTAPTLAQWEGGVVYFTSASSSIFFRGGGRTITKVDEFTTSGTWTVPAGVTYAIAHMIGGGGGIGAGAGAGGNSSVAFASGTVTATGGAAHTAASYNADASRAAGAANSGRGAKGRDATTTSIELQGMDGAYIVAGADVTPGASITVTVGSAGAAGTNGVAGGSGVVWIEYQTGGGAIKKVAAFTVGGTWTVPAGVTYAVANIRAGGGGVSTGASAGGNSSVAFAGGTITATGGPAMTNRTVDNTRKNGAPVNSGGWAQGQDNALDGGYMVRSEPGAFVVAGDTVTPGNSITVTVGAAGGGGSDAAPSGGSGYVWIEYEQ